MIYWGKEIYSLVWGKHDCVGPKETWYYLMDEVKKTVQRELYKCEEKGIKDWSSIKSALKDGLRDYVFAKTKRNPMILPIIMEV